MSEVRIRQPNGTWSVLGSDLPGVGVWQEALSIGADAQGGCRDASFVLRRDPDAEWPDLQAGAKLDVLVSRAQRFSGLIRETPSQDELAGYQISVQAAGDQYRLDRSAYARAYVHADLTAWQDLSSLDLGDQGTVFVPNGYTNAGDGTIRIGGTNGDVISYYGGIGLSLPEGTTITGLAIECQGSANDANGRIDVAVAASGNGYTAVGAARGIAIGNIAPGRAFFWNGFPLASTASRFWTWLDFTDPKYLGEGIALYFYRTVGGAIGADVWLDISNLLVFTHDTTKVYTWNRKGRSVLKASDVVYDAFENAGYILGGVNSNDNPPPPTRELVSGLVAVGETGPDVRHYRFRKGFELADDQSGYTLFGQSGGVFDGSGLTNEEDDTSLRFTTANDRIQFAPPAALNGDWTIMAMIEVPAGGIPVGGPFFVATIWQAETANGLVRCDVRTSGAVGLYNGTGLDVASATGKLIAGKRHHVVWQYDASAATLTIWVDGVSAITSGTVGLGPAAPTLASLGNRWTGAAYSTGFSLADLRIDDVVIVAPGWLSTGEREDHRYGCITPSVERSAVRRAGWPLPSYSTGGWKSAREVIESVSPYEDRVYGIDGRGKPYFRPRSKRPLIQSVAGFSDASRASLADLYNRVVGEGSGPDGAPLIVTRQTGDRADAPMTQADYSLTFEGGTVGAAVAGATYTQSGAGSGSITYTANGQRGTSRAAKVTVAVIGGTQTIWATIPATGLLPGWVYECKFLVRRLVSWPNDVGIETARLWSFVTPRASAFGVKGQGRQHSVYAPYDDYWLPLTSLGGSGTGAWLEVRFKFVALASTMYLQLSQGAQVITGDLFEVDEVTFSRSALTSLDRSGDLATGRFSFRSPQTRLTMRHILDLWLEQHMTTPLRGSFVAGVDDLTHIVGGHPVTPDALLDMVGDPIRLPQLRDPDTLALGRDGYIADAAWDEDSNQVTVAIDNERTSFAALLERFDARNVR